ncbi:DUF805 domain-containing protein [Deinococcus sp. KNUC1210]|uniref:DUF805 domain-containing protein n=1 Tax=Deinococcus sp. KNUC1210 TaxID=2917691 RepID=UPI001EEF9B33|nr:DUF805 domain-containing protein [Deinococcus sp. KNUC1210]ULH14399.1 DUF805 domain-containing protein [Deinococcus sp. KNUC1210]
MNDYLTVVQHNYANFSGRARRREFWMFTLVNSLILLAFAILMIVGIALSNRGEGNSFSPLTVIALVLMIVYGLATAVPSVSVSVRRLHDAGYTGWLELLEFAGLRIVVLIFHVMDSQPGSNKWGPNPKGVSEVKPAF